MQTKNNTIFALSSGSGKSGIAVIRVSGQKLDFLPKPLKPRMATILNFYNIDNLIAIYFPAPNSFTGEDVIELHAHGGIAVVEAIFTKLRSFGFRIAERGEFSRRAFDNGKMDLIEVDSMRALIDAKTEAQRKRALKTMLGTDSEVYIGWRNSMIELAALSAARMDYDADDLPKNINEKIKDKTSSLIKEIKNAIQSKAKIIESGFNIVLVGETNVGKSSLFNRMIGESRAIVSEIAGTTRDVISAELDIDGFLVRLSDTAGIRESEDKIENMGIERTKNMVSRADLVLRVFNPGDSIPKSNDDEILIINKLDLIKDLKDMSDAIYVSAETGHRISDLMNEIKLKLHKKLDDAENDLMVSDRMKEYLEHTLNNLELSEKESSELQAEYINNAADQIGQALGIIGTEEIYDSVFGQLCLGK